jgi:hypothetical protein
VAHFGDLQAEIYARGELDITLALCGHARPADLGRESLVRAP